jgi:biotin-[acetyl-CoA-carboxylase] ligase BirA-like protein
MDNVPCFLYLCPPLIDGFAGKYTELLTITTSKMLTIHLPEVDSTNNYLLRQLAQGVDYPDGTVVYTTVQSCGRGQQGNSWESEPGRNLAFSLLLKPTFLPVTMSFALSELTALAIAETLDEYVPGFLIKWPNDIYHDDRKAVGILIENRLSGRTLSHSIVGVGVNLNQRVFRSDAPNPVSVVQLMEERSALDIAQNSHRNKEGFANSDKVEDFTHSCVALNGNREKVEDFPPASEAQECNSDSNRIDIERTLREIMQRLMGYYSALRAAANSGGDLLQSEAYHTLHTRYLNRLYRGSGLHPYQDATTGERFQAAIADVEPGGALHLCTESGEERRYMFKEVKFCLPCGVVKE